MKKKSILIYDLGENCVTLAQSGSKIYMLDYVVRGFLGMKHKRHFRISEYRSIVEDQEELKQLVALHNIDGILFPNVKLS